MPKVSVNILTKNRRSSLQTALDSVFKQSMSDFEVVVVNDGSRDDTSELLKDSKYKDLKIIDHKESLGITLSRQAALRASEGEYIAILDDDDEWVDPDKLKKQFDFLEKHREYVLVGGGVKIESGIKNHELRMRTEKDAAIRSTMLFRNNFFTSTVMFRKDAALKAGGFVKDEIDLGEDYDLWLRMGLLGNMYNFREVFTNYTQSQYNKEKFKLFLNKQLKLVKKNRHNYPHYILANLILTLRLFISK